MLCTIFDLPNLWGRHLINLDGFHRLKNRLNTNHYVIPVQIVIKYDLSVNQKSSMRFMVLHVYESYELIILTRFGIIDYQC